MATEHIDQTRLAAYLQRQLSAADLLEVDDHLAACDACRNLLSPEHRLETVARAFDVSLDALEQHIEDDQLHAYIANSLNEEERATVEGHLESCAACREEVHDLQSFRDAMVATRTSEVTSSSVASTRPREIETPSVSGIAEWFRRTFAVPHVGLQIGLAAAVLFLAVVVGWQQVRYQQLADEAGRAAAAVDALTKQNELLARRPDIENAPPLTTDRGGATPTRPLLQDTSGAVSAGAGGAVMVAQVTLPPPLTATVNDLISTGEIKPDALTSRFESTLSEEATRSVPSGSTATGPLPMLSSPVLTAVRSLTPTLRWTGVPSAQGYRVVVADPDRTVVKDFRVGSQTQFAVPAGTLQRGQAYVWQIEATVDGAPQMSSVGGFWVLSEAALREVDNAERTYSNSALVLAITYSARGLYDDALAQVDKLVVLNPGNPQLLKFRNRLRSRS